MSLTPDEIAMCRDALLEAGVPIRTIDRILWTKDELRRIRATNVIDLPEYARPLPESYGEAVKRDLYQKIVWHLIEEGIAEVKETRSPVGVEFRLDVTVLTPVGWKPPTKVSR